MHPSLSRLLTLAAPLALLAACASEPTASTPAAAPEAAPMAASPEEPRPATMQKTPPPAPMHLTMRQAQQALANKGYNPGAIDGIAGPRTSSALRQFQRDQGLATTGRLDSVTMEALTR